MSDTMTSPTKRGKRMTDDALVAMLDSGVRQATGYSDSRLSSERLKMQRYYTGELPAPLHAGNSKYVSTDVWDGVESMAAQLLEVFSGNNEPVVFAPQGPDDVAKASEATTYVNYVVFRQNPGFGVFRDVINDGLLGRVGVAKVWWEKSTDEDEFTIEDTTYEELEAYLLENPDDIPKSIEWDGKQGSAIKKATLRRKRDLSQVRILPMPPEEFFISPRATGLHKAELVGHRYRMTYSDLIKQGYPKAKLQDLKTKDDLWTTTEPELVQRHQDTDDMVADTAVGAQDARQTIMVYECYAEIDPEGDGTSELHQIIYAGNVILRKERVKRRPFVAFTPLPKPHAFWGTNYANLLVPVQNARTALTRSIIDHALITNNPRYGVVQGAVADPRELMDNRIGGIVNVRRPDGIFALPQAGLNPFVFQTIAQLDADKEQRTGISKLSQGLNKDAVSKQNSADMIEQLISVSQVRQKVIARNFAEGFLTDLYKEVYRLVLENEDRQQIVKVSGSFTEVDPSSWPERDDLIVQFALGYGEQHKEGMKYAQMDQTLAADPRLGRMYPEQLRYQVLQRAMKGLGITDVTLVNPETLPPPEPDPMMLVELEVKKADAAVKTANAQAAVEKLKLDAMKEQNRHMEWMAKFKADSALGVEKADLARDTLAHKVAVDGAELRMAAEAQASGDLTAVASPNN